MAEVEGLGVLLCGTKLETGGNKSNRGRPLLPSSNPGWSKSAVKPLVESNSKANVPLVFQSPSPRRPDQASTRGSPAAGLKGCCSPTKSTSELAQDLRAQGDVPDPAAKPHPSRASSESTLAGKDHAGTRWPAALPVGKRPALEPLAEPGGGLARGKSLDNKPGTQALKPLREGRKDNSVGRLGAHGRGDAGKTGSAGGGVRSHKNQQASHADATPQVAGLKVGVVKATVGSGRAGSTSKPRAVSTRSRAPCDAPGVTGSAIKNPGPPIGAKGGEGPKGGEGAKGSSSEPGSRGKAAAGGKAGAELWQQAVKKIQKEKRGLSVDEQIAKAAQRIEEFKKAADKAKQAQVMAEEENRRRTRLERLKAVNDKDRRRAEIYALNKLLRESEEARVELFKSMMDASSAVDPDKLQEMEADQTRPTSATMVETVADSIAVPAVTTADSEPSTPKPEETIAVIAGMVHGV
ncbi:hypothetical protein CYMTET_56672 [Cymbomonas tetramitiformis]|uniref:Uncharacterized protein n=1 Tax=Cymbomonas tetramitiformis TaxID=36881 RepID=A0AAE0BC72_9CHLO|nr:hypothetical protein CYMTET_56672 [Cymbomonas tetramitiformis]